MATRADLRPLIDEIENCQDRNERAALYRKYDDLTEELRLQEMESYNSCPECGNPTATPYPAGLNEFTQARGDKCYRCYDCGVQFNKRM